MPKIIFTHCWVRNHRYVTIVSSYILCRLQINSHRGVSAPNSCNIGNEEDMSPWKGLEFHVFLYCCPLLFAHLPTLLEFTIATVLGWQPIWFTSPFGCARIPPRSQLWNLPRVKQFLRRLAQQTCRFGSEDLSAELCLPGSSGSHLNGKIIFKHAKGEGDMLVPRIDIKTIHTKKNSKKGIAPDEADRALQYAQLPTPNLEDSFLL